MTQTSFDGNKYKSKSNKNTPSETPKLNDNLILFVRKLARNNIDEIQDNHSDGHKRRFTALIFIVFHRNPVLRAVFIARNRSSFFHCLRHRFLGPEKLMN